MKSNQIFTRYKATRYITAFILSIIGFATLAQPANKFVKDNVMAAPNAAALGKYGDIPVSHFTGVPNISIPIHTLQNGSLSLPISLSYHASGIKVGELASWVGANWSLNAGGIITRTVQGLPDESTPNYALGYYYSGSTLTKSNYEVCEAYNGLKDTEPDIFNFNINGASGKFYIDANHTARFLPMQDIKLTFNPSFTTFVLTTSDGTKYTFGTNQDQTALEKTFQVGSELFKKYTSSWYLVRIESHDGKYFINLTYDDERYPIEQDVTCSYTSSNCLTQPSGTVGTSYSTGPQCGTTSTIEMDGKRLKQISTPTETVTFVASTVRQDISLLANSPAAKSLDTIKIESGNVAFNTCSQFILSYDYFLDPAGVGSLHKKLKLNQVTEKSCNNNITKPPHVFTYEGNFIVNRFSKRIDHWGFFNDAAQNDNAFVNIPPTQNNGVNYGSSNRESNETAMKKGVLTEIQYPTGGKTKFTYEANTANLSTRVPTEKLVMKSCSTTITQCCGAKSKTSAPIPFTLNDLSDTKAYLRLDRIPNDGSNTCYNANIVTIAARAYRVSDNFKVWDENFDINALTNSNLNVTTYTKPYELLMPAFQSGEYYFVIETVNGYGTLTVISSPILNNNVTVGGLRVKEIRSIESTSSANDIVKTYTYANEISPTISSGYLFQKPTYGYYWEGPLVAPPGSTEGCGGLTSSDAYGGKAWVFMAQSIIPLTTMQGFHVGYEYVNEYLSSSTNPMVNGKTIYNFYIDNQTMLGLNQSTNFPYTPSDFNPTNGNLFREKHRNAANATLKENTNELNPEVTVNSTGLLYKTMIIPDFSCVATSSGGNSAGTVPRVGVYAKTYTIKTTPYRIKKKIETLDGVTSTTEYDYYLATGASTFHLMPIKTTFTNSDNKISITRVRYSAEVLDPANEPLLVEMKNRNIIVPIEIKEEVENIQLKGSRTKFGIFNKTTGTAIPNPSSADIINNDIYPLEFSTYKTSWDANGNLIIKPNSFPNNGWETEATVISYAKGKPTKMNLRGWENATRKDINSSFDATEIYEWDATNGLILTRQFKDFKWQYEYFQNTRLVKKVTNMDGQFTEFIYDDFQRVTQAKARNGAVKTDYLYKYHDIDNSNKNWVETKTTFNAAIGGTLNYNVTFKTARQYFDGLGRPIQSVALANSPNLKDVISVVEYDNQGREFKKYDPFESTVATGAYVGTLPTNQPVTTLEYEASPLSRMWKVTPPNWQPTVTTYSANIGSEAADAFLYIYPANQIYKTTVKDPDNRVSVSYTDKKGRKMGSRQYKVDGSNNIISEQVFTLNGYDDKDRLSKVFTPRNPNLAELNATELDFSYLYDWDDNVTRKKVPDAAAMNFIYNNRNQLVLSQDGNQLAFARYLATQYDLYGRPLRTGFSTSTSLTNGNPDITLPNTLTETEYSAATSGLELGKVKRTKNYFGTYLETFLEYNDVYGRMTAAYGNNHLYSPGGAITNTNFSEKITTSYDLADNILSKTRTHKPNATTTRTITETMDYDNGLRLKQNKHKVDNEAEQTLSYLDYTVKNQVQTKRMGQVNGLAFLQKVDYQYNALGWLTGINAPTLNGSTNAVCALPFANTNGTLDENDLFSLDMRYENPTAAYTPTGTTATPQYGGNISQMVWQVRGKQKQVYTFQYDHLSRMTEANYSELNASNVKIDDANKYMEKLTYDVRGNIKTLQRNGATDAAACQFGQIDNLSYFYNNNDSEASDFAPKNRLRKVTESSLTTKGFKRQGAGGDYTYDANGNLKTDPNKGIDSIRYNHLNLPEFVRFSNGNVIQWLYDAGGRKLRKTAIAASSTIGVNGQPIAPGTYISTGLLTSTGTVSANTTVMLKGKLGVEMLPNFETQVNANFEAVQDATIVGDIHHYTDGIEYHNGAFEAIYHAEGRVTTTNGVLKYEYALRDHLGNTRLMFSDKDNNGVISQNVNQELSEVTQENHQYPFGMAMEGTWSNTPSVNDSKYQFGGKELNSDFGLEWMDFGARQYDASLGRWLSVDPMADLAPNLTTYRYGFNNPVRFTDPNGMFESGNTAYVDVTNRMNELAEKEKKKKEEEKKKKDNVELFYTNNTEEMITTTHVGTVDKLTTGQIASIVLKTGKIMQRNGVNKNITFKPISVTNAKKHTRGDFGYGFVAFISHPSKSYGLSNVAKDGTIGVFNGENFDSWVNYGRIADEKSNYPDPLYGAAFSMAHEYLHQLLAFAGKALENDAFKFSHVNDVPSLNTDGNYIKYPIYPGNPYEVILPSQKAYLQRYFQYLKDQP